MMHVSISRAWLFSRTAQRVYLLCAILNLALLATRIGVAAAMASAGVSALPPTVALLVKGFLFPEIVGSAVLFSWYVVLLAGNRWQLQEESAVVCVFDFLLNRDARLLFCRLPLPCFSRSGGVCGASSFDRLEFLSKAGLQPAGSTSVSLPVFTS